MREIKQATMIRVLNAAITSKRCVKTWLIYGNGLKVGFGDVVLPPPILVDIPGRKPRYQHSGHPPYELRTGFAKWWVERDGESIGNRYEDELVEAASASLLGKRCLRWQLLSPHWGLRVDFEQGLVLQIVSSDPSGLNEVWGMWNSHNYYYTVRPDGSMYKTHGSEPVKAPL